MKKSGAGADTPSPSGPQKKEKGPKKTLQVVLDEDVHKVLHIRSLNDGRSVSDVANQALREWLKAQPPMRPVPSL